MYLLWRFHTEAEVWPVGIIGINRLLDQYAQLGKGSTSIDQELLLEDAVDPLSKSVLVAIIPIGHGWPNLIFPQHSLVQRRAVLDASIRMMYQGLVGHTMTDGLVQRGHGIGSFHLVTEVMAHDLA